MGQKMAKWVLSSKPDGISLVKEQNDVRGNRDLAVIL